MASSTVTEMKREAKDRGLAWSAVQAAYAEIKAHEHAKRQRPDEVRETAWCMANADRPGKWPFWYHGFRSQYGARVDRSDYTAIPRYDVLAQAVASDFPEYATDDGTERLFDFLLSPRDPMPAAGEMYRRAMDLVERGTVATVPDCDEEF